jgi:small conductance mechanosensitive channel
MGPRDKTRKDLYLERMFETRSEEWEKVGLTVETDERVVRRARREAVLLLPLLVALIVVFDNRQKWFDIKPGTTANTACIAVTVVGVLVLGWTIARDIGRAAAPTFLRRMDPGTAGTVGFLIRLATVAIAVLIALGVAGVAPTTVIAGSAFTAVVLGLAAQQTLGNLFAGMVLLSARPFRVGTRVRLQAGSVGGQVEGIVSELGLLYTTLARGDDRILIPNSIVLAAAVVPLKEPESVDVRVRLKANIPPSHVQAILDDQIKTVTRDKARVLLEELDGDDVVIRVQATPDRADDGAKLADELIAVLRAVTREHALTDE